MDYGTTFTALSFPAYNNGHPAEDNEKESREPKSSGLMSYCIINFASLRIALNVWRRSNDLHVLPTLFEIRGLPFL